MFYNGANIFMYFLKKSKPGEPQPSLIESDGISTYFHSFVIIILWVMNFKIFLYQLFRSTTISWRKLYLITCFIY